MWLMKKRVLTIVLGIVICSVWTFGSVFAEDKAYFTSDKTTPLIGEPVQLILHLRIPAQAKLMPPDFANLGSPMFVKQVGSLNMVNQSEGETEYQLPLIIVLWQTGLYRTPPLIISYQLDTGAPVNLIAESVQFDVPSTLDTSDLSLRPLKPQINLPYFPIWTFASTLLVFVAFGVVAVRYWLPRKRLQLPVNALNDKWHPEANVALSSLKKLSQSEYDPPAIYVQVSGYLRQYLDARFALQSGDLTTSELLANLEDHQVIMSDQQQKLSEMLKRADLVKFARMVPKLNTAQQYASLAAQWIQSVEQAQAKHLT